MKVPSGQPTWHIKVTQGKFSAGPLSTRAYGPVSVPFSTFLLKDSILFHPVHVPLTVEKTGDLRHTATSLLCQYSGLMRQWCARVHLYRPE